MSAKNRKRASDPDGAYWTPLSLATQIVEVVLPAAGVDRPRKILEPSVGQGAFLKPLRTAYPLAEIVGVDLRALAFRLAAVLDVTIELGDFLDPEYLEHHDLVIGNPPYEHALEFCRKALVLAPTVVFLLRLGFLAAIKRHVFWTTSPPARVYVLSRRPSFTSDGNTDQTDYCVVCWRAGIKETTLHWLSPAG